MKKLKDIGRFSTVKEAKERGINPADYQPAGVHQTMGPHWAPILWVNNKPYVKKPTR